MPTAGPCSGKLVVNFDPCPTPAVQTYANIRFEGCKYRVGCWSWELRCHGLSSILPTRLPSYAGESATDRTPHAFISAWYEWKVRFMSRAVTNHSILRYLELHPWKGWRRPLMKFNWWVVSLLKTFWNSLLSSFNILYIFHYYKIDSVFETTNAKCESGNWHHPPYHGHKVNPRIHSHSTVHMRRRGETTPSVAGWTSWPQLAGWRHCSNSNRWATSDSQDLTSASYRLMLSHLWNLGWCWTNLGWLDCLSCALIFRKK